MRIISQKFSYVNVLRHARSQKEKRNAGSDKRLRRPENNPLWTESGVRRYASGERRCHCSRFHACCRDIRRSEDRSLADRRAAENAGGSPTTTDTWHMTLRPDVSHARDTDIWRSREVQHRVPHVCPPARGADPRADRQHTVPNLLVSLEPGFPYVQDLSADRLFQSPSRVSTVRRIDDLYAVVTSVWDRNQKPAQPVVPFLIVIANELCSRCVFA